MTCFYVRVKFDQLECACQMPDYSAEGLSGTETEETTSKSVKTQGSIVSLGRRLHSSMIVLHSSMIVTDFLAPCDFFLLSKQKNPRQSIEAIKSH